MHFHSTLHATKAKIAQARVLDFEAAWTPSGADFESDGFASDALLQNLRHQRTQDPERVRAFICAEKSLAT